MKFIIKQNTHKNNKYTGLWFIALGDWKYLWKDLKIHTGTFKRGNRPVAEDAPGYYSSEGLAKEFLRLFKEKHNMADQVEINVKVNGVETPLHKISEQTLLTVRENSKPKEVPAFQVCDCRYGSKRLIFKVSEKIAKLVGQYVALGPDGERCGSARDMKHFYGEYKCYSNYRELKLEEL